jgi:hypothetical protein
MKISATNPTVARINTVTAIRMSQWLDTRDRRLLKAIPAPVGVTSGARSRPRPSSAFVRVFVTDMGETPVRRGLCQTHSRTATPDSRSIGGAIGQRRISGSALPWLAFPGCFRWPARRTLPERPLTGSSRGRRSVRDTGQGWGSARFSTFRSQMGLRDHQIGQSTTSIYSTCHRADGMPRARGGTGAVSTAPVSF